MVATRFTVRARRGRHGATLLPRLLGLLFLVMAAGQLADQAGFRAILAGYDFGAPELLAGTLLSGELLAGAWLLLAPRREPMVPAVVFAATSLLWSTLAAQAFARGLVIDNCGCFGVYLGQPLRWWVLVQGGLLLVYSALLLHSVRVRRGRLRG